MTRSARRLVLLDRDGVINRDSDAYIKSVAEWRPLPGSLEAIGRLTRHGFDVAVVTNQSGVGRGLFGTETLDAIHAAMTDAARRAGGRITAVYYCPHRPDQDCDCRKPKPKLLLDAARDFGTDIGRVPYIGDKASDVEAALAAGAHPILVGDPRRGEVPADVERYPDLAAAADALIARRGCE